MILAFLSGNDVSDNHRALTPNQMRPFYTLSDGRLVLDEGFLEAPRYRRRQTLQWRALVVASEASRVIQVLNEVRNRTAAARRRSEDTALVEAVGPDGETGLSNAVYLDPPPPVWDEAWRVTEAIVERFRDTVRADAAEFFVLSLSNGIQVHPSRAVRERYAEALGVPDLGYPDRRLAARLRALDIPHRVLAPALARLAEASGRCLHGFANAEPCRGHWNEEGHREAGRLLAESLCAHFARAAPGSASRSSRPPRRVAAPAPVC